MLVEEKISMANELSKEIDLSICVGNGIITLFRKHSMTWVRNCNTLNRASIGEFPSSTSTALNNCKWATILAIRLLLNREKNHRTSFVIVDTVFMQRFNAFRHLSENIHKINIEPIWRSEIIISMYHEFFAKSQLSLKCLNLKLSYQL